MSWLPDWVVNAGQCISEVVDDGLDVIKDGACSVENSLHKCQDYLRENTWGIVHVPANCIISVVKKPAEGIEAVTSATDDYFFEDEKREIQNVESNFKHNEAQKVETEEINIKRLNNEAEKYAERELQRLLGVESENSQTDDTQQLATNITNTTLKTAGKCIPGIAPSVVPLATELQLKDDYTK